MEIDWDSIESVGEAFDDATRHFTFAQRRRIEQPLAGNDKQSEKMKNARQLFLRLQELGVSPL